MPSIVQIIANVLLAPTPIALQEMGAIVSQGATTLTTGTYALLTSSASVNSILAPPLAISSITWSGGVATVTTSAAIPGRNTGDIFTTTIAGATPAGYNGQYRVTVTGANTFTFPLATNPGNETVPGTYTPPGQGELLAQNTTYWAQGSTQAVYVLELGAGDGTTGPAALQAWIVANPGIFYSYLVPRGWDNTAGLTALIAAYAAPNAFTYFFVTTSISTYQNYAANKNVVAMVEAPNLPLTEFSLAAVFQVTLNYAPSSTNKQTQLCFAFLYGVTAYPTMGNSALLTQLQAANVGYVATAAEGGLTNTMFVWGNVLSGVDFTFWYSADWAQLNCDQAAANVVINGSNSGLNPLYYSQAGINRLQDTVVATIASAISYGLAAGSVTRTSLTSAAFLAALDADTYAGQCVVNAIPFAAYTQANPNDYAIGKYAGISVVYIPQNGFKKIIFNVTITNLIASL